MVQIDHFLDWKGWPNVHIFFCVWKRKVLLIHKVNEEICVANLMIKWFFFSLSWEYIFGIHSEWDKTNEHFENTQLNFLFYYYYWFGNLLVCQGGKKLT